MARHPDLTAHFLSLDNGSRLARRLALATWFRSATDANRPASATVHRRPVAVDLGQLASLHCLATEAECRIRVRLCPIENRQQG